MALPNFKNPESPHAQSSDSDNDMASQIFASALNIVNTEESEENQPDTPVNEKFASFFKP